MNVFTEKVVKWYVKIVVMRSGLVASSAEIYYTVYHEKCNCF